MSKHYTPTGGLPHWIKSNGNQHSITFESCTQKIDALRAAELIADRNNWIVDARCSVSANDYTLTFTAWG